MQNSLTILGAGSSAGTPVVGCKCSTCLSDNPRNKRTRCSSMVTLQNGKNILIDTSPDLREQSLIKMINTLTKLLCSIIIIWKWLIVNCTLSSL